jgi:filamin
VNSHLRKREIKIDDLKSGFHNGINLVLLLEQLTGKSSPVALNKNPTFRIQKIQNNSIAVDFAKSEKVNVTTVGAEDIVDGELKIILGFIWTLILKYQINKSDRLNKQDAKAKPVSASAVDDSVSTDMQQQSLDELQKQQELQQQQQQQEKSSTSAGGVKAELLSWVSQQLEGYQDAKASDFTKSWKTGRLLANLIHSLAPKHVKAKINLDEEDPITLVTDVIRIAEEELGIPMIVDPEDIINNPEELSMMTYISYFRDYSMEEHEEEEEIPEIDIDPEQCTIEIPDKIFVGERVRFFLTARDVEGNIRDREDEFAVTLDGPSGAIDADILSNGDGTYDGDFIPTKSGDHKLFVVANGASIADTPMLLRILERATSQHSTVLDIPSIVTAGIGSNVEFVIRARNKDGEDITIGGEAFEVEIITPDNQRIQPKVVDKDNGTYIVSFEAEQPSAYSVSIALKGVELDASPFIIVAKRPAVPNKCIVSASGVLNSIVRPGASNRFTVTVQDENGFNVQQGGDDVKVEIKTADGVVHPDVTDNGDGSYDVEFILNKPGTNDISVTVNGEHVTGSPYTVIVEPEIYAPNSNATFEGCKVKYDNCTVTFNLDPVDKFGNPANMPTNMVTVVLDENNQPVDTKLVEIKDQSFTASFKPKPHQREYKLSLSVNGESFKNSPVLFTVEPQLDPSQCILEGPGIEGGDLVSRVGLPALFTIVVKNSDGDDMQIPFEQQDIDINQELIQRLYTYQDYPIVPPTIEKKKLNRRKKADDEKDSSATSSQTPQNPMHYNIRYSATGDSVVEETSNQEIEIDNPMFISPENEPELEFNNALYDVPDVERIQQNKESCPLNIRIQADDPEEDLEPVVLRSGPSEYTIFYMTKHTGDHTISVQYDGQEVVGGPFVATFTNGIDPRRCNVSGPGMKKAYVGVTTSFTIVSIDLDGRVKKVGGDNFEVLVKDSTDTSLKNPVVIEDKDDGTYTVYYTPQMEGVHVIKVKGSGVELPNGSFKVNVLPKSSMPDVKLATTAKISPIVRAKLSAGITVTLPDAKTGGDNVEVYFDQPNNTRLMKKPVVTDNNNGTYTILYEPQLPGKYVAHVKVNNQDMSSPLEIKVLNSLNPSLCTVSNWKYDIASSVPLDVQSFEVEYNGNKQIVTKDEANKQSFTVSYDPPTSTNEYEEEEYHLMDVKLAGRSIQGTPFRQTFVM